MQSILFMKTSFSQDNMISSEIEIPGLLCLNSKLLFLLPILQKA